MSSLPSPYHVFVGIDIAATSASVACATDPRTVAAAFTIAQTPAGFTDLQTRLERHGIPHREILVVLEATNTYWMSLALHLHNAGYAVSVINPAQAHQFAKALLKRAKTDAIDAQTLAQLAATLQPKPWTPPPAIYEELRQRLQQREDLLRALTQERNRLDALRHRPTVVVSVQARSERWIAWCEAEIGALDAELSGLLDQAGEWEAAAKRLRSVPGIGPITAAWLLVETLAFKTCATPQQAAAFAGLAPHPYESGTSIRRRGRIGQGGNAALRRALYMASVSAGRHNPHIKAFYERLRAAGKPVKVARCAAARKLLHLCWAVVTREVDYDPNYGPHTP
ncbi:MAG: IS110 family transposase [Thermomicrobia bacterium]|nr:IS110 family transposase [Thermomicrobia bacterium]MCA1724523.1 IS110 family transposase [Thermomicrobia bacterium]